MDATRLITATRQALAQAADVATAIAEAWQAQALAQAIGGCLAARGDAGLRDTARALFLAGGRTRDAAQPPGARSPVIRAARLTGVRDPTAALRQLLALLAETGAALATLACTTEDEREYWQCVDALDATDETRDRVRALLRQCGAARPESPGEAPPAPP
ncbi:DUF6099 family protein [Streptantibioticus rubrisoli]|uniref:DUF6099 family protein n=1 Tax=Streptantibioticus rubrisoli TaxID=1387313 RepID=A0ABT1PKI8_9ACTN|nr:DUF6099 family protein [Streptantibioticus rubrisoli]MCQ4045876.1 DUF6099 family protein [Streptantibioticus rubrisoli]